MSDGHMKKGMKGNEPDYRMIVEEQSDLICRLTTAFRLSIANRAFLKFFKIHSTDLSSYDWLELLPQTCRNEAKEKLAGLGTDTSTARIEYSATNPEGKTVWLQWTIRVLSDNDGGISGYQTIGRDITGWKRTGEMVRIQRDLAVSLGAASQLTESFQLILDAAFSVDEIDGGGIYFYNPENQELTLVHSGNLSREFLDDVKSYDWLSPQFKLVMSGKPLFVNYNDIAKNTERKGREGLKALGVIPVKHGGVVVGALNIASRKVDRFPPDVAAFAEAISGQIGSIIARIKDNEFIRQSRQNLMNLFQQIDDFIFVTDENGILLEINGSVSKRLGYSIDDLRDKSLLLLHPPARRDEAGKILSEMIAGRADTCSIPLLTGDGGEIPVETKTSWGYWNGQKAIFGISRDLTERIRYENELNKNKERLDLVLEGAELGLWDWNIVTGEVVFNEQWAAMLGYSLDEIEPDVSSWEKLIHPDDMASVMRVLESHLRGETKFYETEHRMKCRDGSWKWILDRGKVVERNTAGEPVRATGTHMDISERKELIRELHEKTEALQQSEKRYRGLLESQYDMIVRVDPDGNFTYVNDAYCRTFGKTREELIGHSYQPLVHPDDLQQTVEAMKGLEHPPYRITVEQRARTDDGWRWFAWEDYVIRDENGAAVEVQAVGRDITDLKEAEQQLIRARNSAQAANRAKSTFLANMSHELRTPMNAIIGISGILLKKGTDLTDRFREGIGLIHDSGKRLLLLINDLLDLSKIEAGQMTPNNNWFGLDEIISDIEKTVAGLLLDKNVSFSIERKAGAPPHVFSDRDKVVQVLMNLLGNSVKFTPGGEISLSVEGDESRLIMIVTDTGIGIDEESIKNVFDPFYQANDSIAKPYQGTGLGLALSKSLVELMGGVIEIESEKGTGTRVRVAIPVKPSEDEESRASSENRTPNSEGAKAGTSDGGRTILIVDDERLSRETLRFILEDEYRCLFAESGMEGIDLLKREPVDMVLLDIMMPHMDGFETFDRMREIDRKIPIIAVTARAMPEERKTISEYGFNAYISKPIEGMNLKNVISQFFKDEG